MSDYRNPALRQLKEQQVRYAPVEKQLEQLDRIETLLSEVDAGRRFPYQYVCFRITEFRPTSYPHLIINGDDLEHDLQLFIHDLAAIVPPVPVEELSEPVWTLEQLSENLKVSTKTLNRWRAKGLTTRWVLNEGRRKVGVRQSLLNASWPRTGTASKGAAAFLYFPKTKGTGSSTGRDAWPG